jgi:hypothetical protein
VWLGRRSGDVIGVFIGAQRISVGVLDGHGVRDGSVFSVAVDQPDVWSSLAGQLAPHLPSSRRRVRACISDHWLAVDCLPWSQAILKRYQAHRQARQHFQAIGFSLAPEDVVELDDAPRGQPRMAVAYPARFMLALDALAAALDARLESVLPMSVLAWRWGDAGHRDGALLAVIEDQAMLLLQGRRRIEGLIGRRLPGDGADVVDRSAVLDQLWRRQTLRYPGWDGAASMKLLALSDESRRGGWDAAPWVRLPPGRHQEDVAAAGLGLLASAHDGATTLNPIRPRKHRAWLLLAALLALSAVWAGQGLSAKSARHELTMTAQADGMPGRDQGVRPPAPLEAKRLQAVNTAIAQLNMPVGRLFQALQPPKDIEVKVLSFKVGATGSARAATIMAESTSSDDMVRYADFLAASVPFTAAHLKQHTWVDDPAGRLYRFTVEASWQP